MPLSALVRQLQQVPLSGEVLQRCDRDERLRLSGAGRGARALISSVLAGCADAPLLVVVPTLEEAGRWAALLELMGWSSAQLYPTSEGSPYEPFDPTSEITWGQLQVLSELLDAAAAARSSPPNAPYNRTCRRRRPCRPSASACARGMNLTSRPSAKP